MRICWESGVLGVVFCGEVVVFCVVNVVRKPSLFMVCQQQRVEVWLLRGTYNGKCNGKSNGKSNGKNNGNDLVVSFFGLRSGLRQSGGRLRGGILERPKALEGAEKVASWRKSVPQRLKPHCKCVTCGTAEAVPLSKTDFFSTLFRLSSGLKLEAPKLFGAFVALSLFYQGAGTRPPRFSGNIPFVM